MAERLTGKTAIVTGAGSGIGRAIAQAFVDEGAQVIAVDLNEVGLVATRDDCTDPALMLVQRADVSDPEQVEALVHRATAEFGSLTTMVNNAAISIPGTVVDTSWDDYERTMAVNVRGVYAGCKYAIPAMLAAGGGSIINIGSVNSLVAERVLSSYIASKGAVLMLSKSVALDFAAQGIRCNCICPGWVDTPINLPHAEAMGGIDLVRSTLPDWQPIGREGRPSEIAWAAVFLASDESRFMTGSAMVVDGGMTAA
ncbi:MAG: glucose 1-dehydrogenase [Actinobacteria bacterium]|uniref:Unannotated protein n=1 Tax=freshwater metagenome TaxID=449393 RepID=A0A6J7ND63_9ZZZZ|nr:glucose 1-dehydrogenase [Actinomycetota bacterium]